ncbi:Hcp family type VI secretion system effector [Robbsia andropogonis]|uniref:Hcp family type VI secretion system effector n=1 Tax=Robbsia andropogonis TaxID=28092 RepID=UPI0004B10C37|nr:type VI secretion system tube protein Hcp [Robbsia andropogonis]MCP1117729.1 type VI secretion system tube protein Hcp [Robbsia andropogonis]MCP1127194.1 type VI secretion system tube protein Hcp [Robbsia andropogonis]
MAILLKLDGVKGNSTMDGFADTIELEAISFGISNHGNVDPSNSGRGSGIPSGNTISITKRMDMSTPPLYQACADGKSHAEATISIVRNADKPTADMVYKLTNVIVVNVGCNAMDMDGSDSILLSFSAIEITYKTQNKDATGKGNTSAKWDFTTNKAS